VVHDLFSSHRRCARIGEVRFVITGKKAGKGRAEGGEGACGLRAVELIRHGSSDSSSNHEWYFAYIMSREVEGRWRVRPSAGGGLRWFSRGRLRFHAIEGRGRGISPRAPLAAGCTRIRGGAAGDGGKNGRERRGWRRGSQTGSWRFQAAQQGVGLKVSLRRLYIQPRVFDHRSGEHREGKDVGDVRCMVICLHHGPDGA
jgi:hypothetical protein